jgi:hypothetical protein
MPLGKKNLVCILPTQYSGSISIPAVKEIKMMFFSKSVMHKDH